MNTTKVIVDNWPQTNHLLEYIPHVIAVFALGVSWYSVYLTRNAFIVSQRPYVWALNYGIPDQRSRAITPVPSNLSFRVTNSPARILREEVKITLGNQDLANYAEENFVKYPDDRSEWGFSVGRADFERILNRPEGERANLIRLVAFKYTSLNGGKIYNFELRQRFISSENQWHDISSNAD